MDWLRQQLVPLLVSLMTVAVFLVALVAVSARIFLPGDMLAPAPVGLLSWALGDSLRTILTVWGPASIGLGPLG